MADERAPVEDLFGLDRDVAGTVKSLAGWRARLARGEGDGDDPFEDDRHVSSKSTWDTLGALRPVVALEPLRDGLRRWVLALVVARLEGPVDIAWAQATRAPSGRYDGPVPRLASWTEAWREIALARTPAEAGAWLAAAAEAAPALGPLQRRRAAGRHEAAQRQGLAHPWEGLLPVPHASLRASALRVLDRTEDLSRAIWREALGDDRRAPAVLHAVVAREAGDGWPARLTPRWLEDAFGAFTRGLTLDLPALPPAAGAASFARALAMFGFAVREASPPRSMPFALAHEPASLAAHRFARVTGALAADPAFQVRALGIGRHSADAQARVLARSALFEARLDAARLVLGDDASPGRDVFEELTARLFGAPIDERFADAWPRARTDEPGRWLATLQAPALRRELRDTFDADWFRNPRAWAHLREAGGAPAYAPVDAAAVDASADGLARAFEEALG
jgi:hypothetical protein